MRREHLVGHQHSTSATVAVRHPTRPESTGVTIFPLMQQNIGHPGSIVAPDLNGAANDCPVERVQADGARSYMGLDVPNTSVLIQLAQQTHVGHDAEQHQRIF